MEIIEDGKGNHKPPPPTEITEITLIIGELAPPVTPIPPMAILVVMDSWVCSVLSPVACAAYARSVATS